MSNEARLCFIGPKPQLLQWAPPSFCVQLENQGREYYLRHRQTDYLKNLEVSSTISYKEICQFLRQIKLP